MWNPLRRYLSLVASVLVWLGLLDRDRAQASTDLAWPQMVTSLARQSRRIADLAMVGIALGPAAVAGLGFAYTYWLLVGGLAVGTAGATLGLVSQRYGAEDHRGVDLVVKQSVLLGLVLALPITAVYWAFADQLISLLGADPTTRALGGTYLSWLSLGYLFKFMNIVAARTLIGADDAWTPMAVRLGGGGLNVLANVVLIFGLGLGVVGAAVGTALATATMTVWFAWGLVSGRAPFVGRFPVRIELCRPVFDWSLMGDVLAIAWPLVVRRVGAGLARFPFIALVATFGPLVVAAYTVSRRIRGLVKAASDGFGDAASSLVGRELGRDDEAEAESIGRDVLRFSVGVQLATGLVVSLFAEPIARLFVQTPSAVEATVPFIWIVMVAVVGLGIDATATGTLRAGGDTTWPMYGRLVGKYATVPLAYLGTVTPLGLAAVYLALLVETYLPAGVTLYRFRTGRWKAISRTYRPGADP